MRLLRRLLGSKDDGAEFRSEDYWRARYSQGGTSGAGSYGRLADHKAQVINDLVEERNLRSVVEFGSGDGNQCSLLRCPRYLGVDVSPTAVAACALRFRDRPDWSFMTLEEFRAAPRQADLTLSLDVIYHLTEDEVFEDYMQRLFAAATRLVLIYSSDDAMPSKARHVRHRRYSDWVAAHAPEFGLLRSYEQPYPMRPGSDPRQTSFAHFKLFGRTRPEPKEGRS